MPQSASETETGAIQDRWAEPPEEWPGESDAADATKSIELEKEVPGATGAEAISVAMHNAGRCSPCLYFASDYGCSANCRYCHLAHGGIGGRPRKKWRDEFKEKIQRAFEQQALALLITVPMCLSEVQS